MGRGASGSCTNLFRACDIDSWPRCRGDGKPTTSIDRAIGRVVVELAGAVPSSNSLRLPRLREDGLDAPGRFLYLQLRLHVGRRFAIHADIATADRSLHRVSISNLYAAQQGTRARCSGVQAFLPAAHGRWTLLALDLAALAQQASRSPLAGLRSLQLCANMTVRGAFTSDVRHDWQSLPTDLSFTTAFDASQADVLWVPAEPAAVRLAPPKRQPALPRPPLPHPLPGRGNRAAAADGGQQQSLLEPPLEPAPAAALQRVSGFSGRPGLLQWVPSGSNQAAGREISYATGSLVVAMDPSSGQQRHLRGHSAPVVAAAFSASGDRLATAEEGPGAALRLWDFRLGRCLATVPGHAGGCHCLDLAPSGSMLVSAGVDGQGRQEVACWDVSACWDRAGGGGAALLARQASGHNVQAVRFVVYDPDRLVTCGKNSIRIYRLKDGQLRGVSVPMEGVQSLRRPYSRGTLAGPGATASEVFTCLAFDNALRVRPQDARRLHVGSSSGAVYTVDLERRAVVGVAQPQDGAVASLAVCDGLRLTGAADRLLRVCGGDAKEVQLEAAHEGTVTGLAPCPSGVQVAVGTDSGALCLLDLASRRYTTLLRSHAGPVHAVAPFGPERPAAAPQYCTAGADGTVRVWDAGSHEQVLELAAPGEAVLSMACHPGKPEVACAFQDGLLRIFNAGGAVLVLERPHHGGRVACLAYVRRGRMLVSLGDDGCVFAWDHERGHLPSTLLQAGLPLHATAMAASQDGRLLAVASRPAGPEAWGTDQQQQLSTSGARTRGTASKAPPPMITLFDMLSLQPSQQFPVAGRSPLSQLQLLPSGGHVLGMTVEGRLQGYRCSDGSQVLNVPGCLSGPCSAMVLDQSGTLLVAASATGQLKAWRLHPGSMEPAVACGPTTRLACQEFGVAAGSVVLGATFVTGHGDGLQLLTAGQQGEVCSWSFPGLPACDPVASGDDAPDPPSSRTEVTAPQEAVPAAAHAAGRRAMFSLNADCTAAAPAAPRAPSCRQMEQDGTACSDPAQPAQQMAAVLQAGSSDAPVPRALPAALQNQSVVRPPSAPAALPRPALVVRTAAGQAMRILSGSCPRASLQASPLHSRCKVKAEPFWARQGRQAEASLIVTAGPSHRCSKVVGQQQRQLIITSPGKVPGVGASRQPSRTAAWVEGEVEGDRVPLHHPRQQLQLLPPTAEVVHVLGFEAGAGFSVQPGPDGQRQLVYAASNVVLCLPSDPTGRQRQLARLPRRICALTVHGGLVAAAVQPADGQGGAADVHIVDPARGPVQAVLSHHSYAVQSLAFSPDGSLLVSLSSATAAALPSTSLALWSVGEAELVAAVQLEGTVVSLAWRPDTELPTFFTAGSQGLLEWRLEPDELRSTTVHMPVALRGLALTAVASSAADQLSRGDTGLACWLAQQQSAAEAASAVFVGDELGRVWRLLLDDARDAHSPELVTRLEGQRVSCLQACGCLCAAGTASGELLLLQQDSQAGAPKPAAWHVASRQQLDGPVVGLQLDTAAGSAAAASECGTLWQSVPGQQPSVLLCGQQHSMRGCHLVPCSADKQAAPLAAIASAAGVAVWALGEGGRLDGAPLVEFGVPADATHATLAPDASRCAAAYGDGSICLFDVAAASLRWKVAGAEQQGSVVALAVLRHQRGCRVLAAYRSGALLMLDGASGQVAHRSMQYAVVQDSGRRCPLNFPLASLAVCPGDAALFLLCGRQELAVCRAAWTKHAAIQTVARLSFGPADAAPDGASGDALAPSAGPAVVAAFSRAHPSHLYCCNPAAPGQLLLFDYATRAIVKTLLAPLAGAHITALALHPREELVAAGTSAGGVLLLRLESEAWAELGAHGDGSAVAALAFSACGRELFTAAGTAAFVWRIKE